MLQLSGLKLTVTVALSGVPPRVSQTIYLTIEENPEALEVLGSEATAFLECHFNGQVLSPIAQLRFPGASIMVYQRNRAQTARIGPLC